MNQGIARAVRSIGILLGMVLAIAILRPFFGALAAVIVIGFLAAIAATRYPPRH